MKKIFFFSLLFLNTLLFGCAACQLMIPAVDLDIRIDSDKRTLKAIYLQWNFSDDYSSETLSLYDKNKNALLEKKELNTLRKDMVDYLSKKGMLTKIEYTQDDENKTIIQPVYQNFDIKMIGKALRFTYDAPLKIEIQDQSVLSLVFEDDEAYFTFRISHLDIPNFKLYHSQNLYLFTASILFSDTPIKSTTDAEQESKAQSAQLGNETSPKKLVQPEKETLQSNILTRSIAKIKSLFESIKDEKNPLTYLLLLFFAYLYGLVHALGPGHGKTLVASYFLSNDRSYSKALFVSLAIGFVHTLSAFLLTLVIYLIVHTFLAQFINDTVFYTTKIAALIIIAIALYLISKKYKAYPKVKKIGETPTFRFRTTPHDTTCGCASCRVDHNSTDIALILSAGIIPCPGTTTLFIFAISLGLYYAGFVSALVMSLGMSTVIFFSALLSVAIRKKTLQSNSNLKNYLEYGSLAVMLLLGLVLLFS